MDKAYLWEKLGHLTRQGLMDASVLEVMLNPDGQVWYTDKQKGPICAGQQAQEESNAFVHALAQYQDHFLNASTPYLDAVLPFNGERINITIPPISEAVSFNIRKKSKRIFTLEDYVAQNIMTPLQKEVLVAAIGDRKNILVCGSPASGKTTLTNALLASLAQQVDGGHRVLMLEQVPELQCAVANLKTLLVSEGIPMQILLWIAMRNAPDRIIVGEVRDGAALDCLKAWNTGCPGGIATIHANHPRAAIQRVLDLACEVVLNPPLTLAAEVLDIIVHIERCADRPARRRITEIVAVEGYDAITQQFQCRTLC